MTRLQTLQSSVIWYHVLKAEILLDTYSGLLSEQSMILAMNSSFVDPLMQFESQLRIIQLSFKKVFSMPSLSIVKAMGWTSEDTEDLENLYQNIFNIFEDTLLILVSKDFYKIQILKEMATWMNEDTLYQQERAMMVITRVLIFASKRVKKYPSIDAPCLGILAAELSLFCSHDDPEIIKQAITGMNYVLYIALCQNSNAITFRSLKTNEKESNPKIITSDVELLAKITQGEKTKLVQSVGQILLPQLLTDFVWTLLKKLSSPYNNTAKDAASLLKLTLEFHAQKITRVSKIVNDIYEQLSENSSYMMQNAMLPVISLLTRASPKKVIFQLMEFPVPADKVLLLMWQAASVESSVASEVLKTILLILKGKPGEMEETMVERRRFSLDATNMMPVAASQALCTFLPVTSYRKVVVKFFPEFLMALLLQLFYCSQHLKDTAQDRPLYVRDALKALLNCSGLEEVDKALERKNFWDQFSQVMDHQYGIHLIAKTLSECNFPQFPETLHYVYKVAVEGPRRSEDSIVTIIFFAELLNNFFKESLPEEFLVLFRNWINDSNPSVGKMSLQKIASMAPVFSEIESVCNLLLPVLDAFLSKEHTVIIRAMLTLRNILGKLDKVIYSKVCIRIASSYCPLMDHVNGGIQCMAIRHFGELLMDMNQYNWMLHHIVLGSLVPLILFLESKETRIVNACRYTLTICTTQLKWSTAHLLKEETYNFESVVLDVCNNLLSSYEGYITDLISDTLGFLGSSRAFLKKGAIILVGYLGKSGEHLLLRDEIDIMIEVIERLTREEDPLIKELVEKTRKLFKEMANRMASSTVKQTFRKWAKMFRTKKLKLIYDAANMISPKEGNTESIKEDNLIRPNLENSKELHRVINEDKLVKPNVKKSGYFP
ncbi:maestro heat-like repeat-containing protein family member 9 isoform X2 [Rattus norvegicus]|uniref:maestro heat-like repeat family member 9 isoform 2 n=1 Tax=Rattus norvegicus TaxID=10116 RepID=UPI0004E494F8|nr:maestro heat-like repeat-containing protein family member 9 isoform X2 [Rattus norvegicus]|eukprot:XP_008767929.1 PREDICTED: maestro heat-like repeat-containing protein family member 9 isoform X2 [Rattus norvegicus]